LIITVKVDCINIF